MSVDLFFPHSDARYPGVGVLDTLLRWREAARVAPSECHVLERPAIEAHRATIVRQRRVGAALRNGQLPGLLTEGHLRYADP